MFTIRKAIPGDRQNLKKLARRVVNTNYTPFLGDAMTAGFIESGMSDKEIDDGFDDCTVMFDGEDLIGFGITKNDRLHLIMVDIPFQNKGYGSKLLNYLEQKLFEVYDCTHLQSFKDNEPTNQFYIKRGWLVTGQTIIPETNTPILLFKKTKPEGSCQ